MTNYTALSLFVPTHRLFLPEPIILALGPFWKEETHNLIEVKQFLFKSFHIRRLQKQIT